MHMPQEDKGKARDDDPGGCFLLFAVVFILFFLLERCSPHQYPWNGQEGPRDVQYSKEEDRVQTPSGTP